MYSRWTAWTCNSIVWGADIGRFRSLAWFVVAHSWTFDCVPAFFRMVTLALHSSITRAQWWSMTFCYFTANVLSMKILASTSIQCPVTQSVLCNPTLLRVFCHTFWGENQYQSFSFLIKKKFICLMCWFCNWYPMEFPVECIYLLRFSEMAESMANGRGENTLIAICCQSQQKWKIIKYQRPDSYESRCTKIPTIRAL